MGQNKPHKKFREKLEKKRKELKEKELSEKKSGKYHFLQPVSYVILMGLFLFSFYIRGILPVENVFRGGIVGFAMDDAVFHMRLVENTLNFFPHRIFFDAFTQYPYGNQLHWGPLFEQMIAFFSIIAGFLINGGMPAQSTIDTVGAFYPAILGALTVFPVFFIGKELIDEKAGLIGAFLIAILPGQFLSRSVLGFTDNHVAEVFYLTLMMMFFIMAIKRAENITLYHWLNKDWNALKTPVAYSVLAGISFGSYLLNWTAGVFFAVVFAIFIMIQYIIDHFRGRSTEYLGIVGFTGYSVAMIMVLPYVKISNGFDSAFYSLLHIVVTGGAAIIFLLLSIVSREMNKQNYGGFHYLLFMFATIVVGLILIKIITPALYAVTVGNLKFIFTPHVGGTLTVAEASPITPEMAMGNFGYNYILSYIGIIVLCYYVVKRLNAEYTLLVVWSAFVLAIMLAQNRFAYYYAANTAILSGILGSKFIDLAGWKHIDLDDILKFKTIFSLIIVLISVMIVIAVTGLLPSNASPYKTTMEQSKYGAISEGFYEWYDALNWMRYNTPEPDLPYYSIYEKPQNGQKYNYSIKDYGVMSWWDYGHIITYWGHRIPNANPFQAGIGGGPSHAPGASTFLIAQTEEGANNVLEQLGTNDGPGARYVASNAYMAYAILTVFAEWDETNTGYYSQVRTDRGTQIIPTMKYYNTMEAKLHIFDTNGLKNYRLVHESTPAPYYRGGNEEKFYKSVYNILYGGNVSIEDSGYVKIFEYVKGAKITGRALPNTTVTLSNTIKTNIGRTIQYSQITSSDGTYEFTVPYSTEGPINGETQFDTGPTGAYTVTAGSVIKQIRVGEKEVLNGGRITLDMI